MKLAPISVVAQEVRTVARFREETSQKDDSLVSETFCSSQRWNIYARSTTERTIYFRECHPNYRSESISTWRLSCIKFLREWENSKTGLAMDKAAQLIIDKPQKS